MIPQELIFIHLIALVLQEVQKLHTLQTIIGLNQIRTRNY